ncbi:MAG: RNA methyltransferase, partial [Thermoanaerobaculia bacterium]
MKTIASRHNPWFQRLREAARDHSTEILLEGPKAIADARKADWSPIVIVHRAPTDGDDDSAAGPDQLGFSAELFDSIAATRTPQSVLALFERPQTTLAAIFRRPETIVVALDAVQDPGNAGAIVRLAAAFDAGGVVFLSGSADPYGPKTIRGSAGTILSVPVTTATVRELFAASQSAQFDLFVADRGGLASPPPTARAVLIFGNEGSGPSDEIRRIARPVSIAMTDRVESLNVATAAAILLWQSHQ